MTSSSLIPFLTDSKTNILATLGSREGHCEPQNTVWKNLLLSVSKLMPYLKCHYCILRAFVYLASIQSFFRYSGRREPRFTPIGIWTVLYNHFGGNPIFWNTILSLSRLFKHLDFEDLLMILSCILFMYAVLASITHLVNYHRYRRRRYW